MTKEEYANATTSLGEYVKWEETKKRVEKAYNANGKEIKFVFGANTEKEFYITTVDKELQEYVYNAIMKKIDERLEKAKKEFSKL